MHLSTNIVIFVLVLVFVLGKKKEPFFSQVNLTELCIMNFLNQVQDNTAQELTQEVSRTLLLDPNWHCFFFFFLCKHNISLDVSQVVERYLNIIIKLMNRVKSNTTENKLMYYGNAAMDLNQKLVSKLVKKTETYNISISVQNLGMISG